jgi:hypothetical protein
MGIPSFGSQIQFGQLQLLLQDQLAAMGDYLTTDVGSLNWIEAMTNARALTTAYQLISLLSSQLTPQTSSVFLNRWAAIYNIAGLNNPQAIEQFIELKQAQFGTPPLTSNVNTYLTNTLGNLFIDVEVAPELQPFASTGPVTAIDNADGYYYTTPLSRIFVYLWQLRDNKDNLLIPTNAFNLIANSWLQYMEEWCPAGYEFIPLNLTNRGFQDGYADGYNGTNFNNYLDGYNIVSGTSGDNHLVGIGTAFLTYPDGSDGDFVRAVSEGFFPPIQIVDDNNQLQTYFVLSVQNNTHLTLTTNLINNITHRTYRTLGCVLDTPGMLDAGMLLNNGWGTNIVQPPIPPSGLALWLKADTGFLSSPNTWSDQSGNGNDFIGYGGGNTPTAGTSINGHATVEFNGSSQGMQTDVSHTLSNLTSGTAFSFFCVVTYTGAGTKLGNLFTPPIFIDQSGDFGVFGITSAGHFEVWAATDAHNNTGLVTSTSHASGSPQYLSFIQANTTGGGNGQNLTLDGDSPIAQDGIGFTGILASRVNIGHWTGVGAAYHQGAIGEIIMYNRAVSGSEEAAINAYLKSKFGL